MGVISRRAVVRAGGLVAAGVAMGTVPGLGQAGMAGAAGAAGARVRTTTGEIEGTVEAGGVRVFRGVPFAEAPVGPLRFKPTVPVRAWTGVRPAGVFSARATQRVDGKTVGSEDCLYLNVWAPAGAGPFPVYVWIHGGGFTGGSAMAPVTDGTEFARDGVVFVTVAYRLGVFGFLDMEPLLGPAFAGSGNNGLRDMVEALRWVSGNIGAFGGDRARVTIGGESAGAKATAALLAIGEARPLFQSAISESGGGERVWTHEEALAVAREYGAAYRGGSGGAAAEAGEGLLPELQTVPAERLMAAQEALNASSARHFPFRSEVDGSYLKARPVDVVGMVTAKGKRMLIGTNLDESALFLGPHPPADPTARDLGNLSLERFDGVLAKYKALYPAMPAPALRVRAVTAEEYMVPSMRLLEAFTRSGGVAWTYRLDYSKTTGRYAGEAYHSEDVRLVFNKPEPDEDAAGVALGRQMHAAWVAFIKGGAPAAAGLPAWPSDEAGAAQRVMLLDRMSRVATAPMEAELALWQGVM